MKKMFIFALGLMTMLGASAQTSLQTTKPFDNVYVGLNGGVATDKGLNTVSPDSPVLSLRVGKQFSPVYSAEIEGLAFFSTNKSDNTVKTSYLGLNGLVNLNNLFCGYNNKPRTFEVSAVAGTGWIHNYTPHQSDKYNNYLGAKTGLDIAFNLGQSKKHTINVRPEIFWNLSEPGNRYSQLAFNRHGSQYLLTVGYTYHFKTSNGTHYFKEYNIETYESTIARLREQLRHQEVQVREVVKDLSVKDTVVQTVTVQTTTEHVVFFAKNSYDLTEEVQNVLKNIVGTVNVYGYASPEGKKEHNDMLSYRRAEVVARFLKAQGVTVKEVVGYGALNETSNRVAIVITQ
mgnify:CR=1 FL=1|jgi:outer membrane protein OmpA-like peptidoglycan-associated protein